MDNFPVCTQCGFTVAEYRSRGLLGCPHCYAAFGEALQADLMWIHGALEHVRPAQEAAPAEKVAHWREQLADALRKEDYGEAARLRRLLDAPRDASHGMG